MKFSGFQVQDDQRTVAGELEHSLKRLFKGQDIHVLGSGRTDAGVHAEGQVVRVIAPNQIDATQLLKALRSVTSEDINITSIDSASQDFHAIKDAKQRHYRYLFTNEDVPLSLKNRIVQIAPCLEPQRATAAVEALKGAQDFRHFSCVSDHQPDTVKTVVSCQLSQNKVDDLYGQKPVTYWALDICADSFLYKMIRNIMGFLFDIMREKYSIADLKTMLLPDAKRLRYQTAPAYGLSLVQVAY